jgi:hypothetical protein
MRSPAKVVEQKIESERGKTGRKWKRAKSRGCFLVDPAAGSTMEYSQAEERPIYSTQSKRIQDRPALYENM